MADNVISLYGELCPTLPKVLKQTPQRKRAALSHVQHTGIDSIHDAFTKAEATPFLIGQNSRGWKADFDWLMRGDNMLKVLEGSFDHSGYTPDPDLDRSFKNQNTYTKEQFAAMDANIFDLRDL